MVNSRGLEPVADGVIMWAGGGGHGNANAVVVIDDDGLTVVDSLISPAQVAELADACAATGAPVRRLVLTSSHIEFVGGSASFPLAAVYGSPQTSAHLDQPVPLEGCRRLHPDHGADLGDGLVTRRVSHVVTEAAWISASAVVVPLAGELGENLAVQIPGVAVVACGALASFGTTPLLFDGDPQALLDSIEVLRGHGTVFVPGHGPVGTTADLDDLAGYLRACIDAAGEVSRLGSGPWDRWLDRRFDVVNVERAAMLAAGDPAPPPSMLRLLGA